MRKWTEDIYLLNINDLKQRMYDSWNFQVNLLSKFFNCFFIKIKHAKIFTTCTESFMRLKRSQSISEIYGFVLFPRPQEHNKNFGGRLSPKRAHFCSRGSKKNHNILVKQKARILVSVLKPSGLFITYFKNCTQKERKREALPFNNWTENKT